MLSLVIEAGGGTRESLVLDPQWVKIWKTIETTIFCCRPSLSLSLRSPYSVCSTKGEAKQQNTKTEKRKNENTKRKGKE